MDKYFWLKLLLNFFEFSAFLTGILYWKKVRNTYWKWFVVYLGVIFLTEMLAKYFGYGLKNPKANSDIYFFFGIPIQFIFFFLLFNKWFTMRKDKLTTITGAILYIASWVVDLYFFRGEKMWFSSFSYLIGSLILFLILIISFLRFVNSDQVIDFRRSMFFWMGSGMLIFYIGTLPFYGLRNFWYTNYKQVFYPYWDATYFISSIMYLFFAIAFICGKPK